MRYLTIFLLVCSIAFAAEMDINFELTEGECSGYCVFKLSNDNNAHLGLCSSDYPWSVCSTVDLKPSPSGENGRIISYMKAGSENDKNLHAFSPQSGSYLSISADLGDRNLKCEVKSDCGDIAEVIGISGNRNAHLGIDYTDKICCNLTYESVDHFESLIDFDGDGYFLNDGHKTDCDDDNDQIFPGQLNDPFNGKDDDCDGEIDENSVWKQEPKEDKTFCTFSNGNLVCTGGTYTVYQRLPYLKEGDYVFDLDIISGNANSNVCGAPPCKFTHGGGELIFRMTLNNAVVDNASIYFVDENMEKYNHTFPSDLVSEPVSCCPEDHCWDGSSCIDSDTYMQDTQNQPWMMNFTEDGYRCVKERESDNAEWSYAYLKFDPLNNERGYCPYENQCFVDAENSDDEPLQYGCVESGIFSAATASEKTFVASKYFEKGDYYCNDGMWTSRTRLVAMRLLETAKNNNFVLYCDSPRKVINYYNDNFDGLSTSVSQSLKASLFTQDELFNNFCALVMDTSSSKKINETFDKDDQVIIAASINYDFAQTIGQTSTNVDTALNSLFESFKKDTDMMAIYSSTKTYTLGSTIFDKIFGAVSSFFSNVFETILEIFTDLDEEPLFEYNIEDSYLFEEDLYNKIYVSSVDGKVIEGIGQKKMTNGTELDFALIKYSGYDICQPMGGGYRLNVSNQANQYLSTYASSINCTSANEVLITGEDITAAWMGMTSNLRPR